MPALVPSAAWARWNRWARSAVVELEGAGEGVEDGGGHPGEGAALQPGVVLDADPGEGGDFSAPQAGHPAEADLG